MLLLLVQWLRGWEKEKAEKSLWMSFGSSRVFENSLFVCLLATADTWFSSKNEFICAIPKKKWQHCMGETDDDDSYWSKYTNTLFLMQADFFADVA